MTFARECLPFVLPPAALAVVLLLSSRPIGAGVVALLALGLLLFFRIPRRRGGVAEDVVLAPANGRVTAIEQVEDPEIGPGVYHRVVTFLSAFDVHVQRAPVSAEVIACRFTRGRKLAAFDRRAGEVNENHLAVLRAPGAERFAVRQIAGLMARRVVSYLEPGQRIERGQLIGLIKFGSRVDLYLPDGFELLVRRGDRLREGATPVARPAGGGPEA